MAFCDELITSALDKISEQWTCRPLDDGWLLITTGHQYSDGDYVELLARRNNQSVVVTDGGEAKARLDLAGVNIDLGRAKDLWRRLLRAHELEVHNERLSTEGTVAEVGTLIDNMANAVTNIDGMRLLATPPPAPRFAQRVVTFFQAEFEYVEEGPQLQGRSGGSYKATAAIGLPHEQTFVQAVSGGKLQTRQRSIEHAFTMFSDVNGTLPAERKLIVLSENDWRLEQTRLLATVAYVSSWSNREQIIDFLNEPERTHLERILIPLQNQFE